MGLAHFGPCTIPKFLQPNIRCQPSLTPNIELALRQLRARRGPAHDPQFLVELTGIEPVASWLQTRRSPS